VAIKGGDLIHIGNTLLIDRAQTIGPGQVTINREKIYEVGNYFSLGSILDTPDLSFTVESFDASAAFEATLLNQSFTVVNGIQTVAITGNPTGGDFTITYGGQTTAAIPYNATANAVKDALEATSAVVPGDLDVTGPNGGPFVIAFSGHTGGGAYTIATASATGLTGGTTPAVNVTGAPGVGMQDGTALKPAAALPLDIASAFKPGFSAANAYDVIGSVSIPYVQLESLQYQFGISEQARQTATLRGDSLFYSPTSTFIEEFAGTNTAGQDITVAHPAIVYHGDTTNSADVNGTLTASTRYALSVSLVSGKRLLPGADYTEAVDGSDALTVTITDAVPTTDRVRISYASTTPSTYPQTSHAAVTAVRPAAIRGRNVEVFIGGRNLSDRWTSVQSVNVQWQVTLEKDEELGNAQAVAQTFDTPQVTGSVELKPRDYPELYDKICQIAGVTPGEVAGPLTTEPLPLLVVLHSPDTGEILKTIEVPDARFTLPGYSGQAGSGQKINVTFNFEGDTGDMTIYKGTKPA
jgi:hypothetical protein